MKLGRWLTRLPGNPMWMGESKKTPPHARSAVRSELVITHKHKIRFLHTMDPKTINLMCKLYDCVEVSIQSYDYEEIYIANGDGTHTPKLEKEPRQGITGTIKSSKDLVQFDTTDMKRLSSRTKKELR
jgi:hypothetical protein